jgi:hypothetical protein
MIKKLKLRSDQFSGQLDTRLVLLQREQDKKIEDAKRQGRTELNNLERDKQKKIDHLKYFNEKVMQKLLHNKNFTERKLTNRFAELEREKKKEYDIL